MEIPKNAPEGEIVLNSLDVIDNFGNATRITLFWFGEGWVMKDYLPYRKTVAEIFTDYYQPKLTKAATAEIVASLDPNYVEDKLPPKLVDAYFSKVSIKNGESIDLFVRFEDESKIRYPEITFEIQGCRNDKPVWKEIEHHLFKASFTIKCYDATTNTV